MNKNNQFSKKIYTKKMIAKIERKMKLLGTDNNLDTMEFLNVRLITSILLFFVVLYVFKLGYILAPVIVILYYVLLEKIVLDDRIRLRNKKLEQEAIHFFEVLTLSLETGRNLEESLTVTIKSIDSELSNEFKNAIREVKYGKSLTEALQDMQVNIPSENINNIILSLTQANLFGNSIIETLYEQVEYIREKRKLAIKAEISKVPIKISVISVLFFVPLILLIILGPVLLSYL